MRYLTTGFAIATLRRGRSIEQFLGPHHVDSKVGVRWVEIRPDGNGYKIVLHEVLDLDGIADLYEFPPLVEHGEEYFGQDIGAADTESGAMSIAATYGTEDNRWVNQGVTADEYHDCVKARRETQRSQAGQEPVDRQI
jgi:hypothetical protein